MASWGDMAGKGITLFGGLKQEKVVFNFRIWLLLMLQWLCVWAFCIFGTMAISKLFCLGSSNKFLLVSVSLLPQIQMLNLFIDHCRENFPEQSCSDRRTVWLQSSKWMLIQKWPNLFRRSSGQKLFGVARGRWFIAANEDVGGCWHWPPETQYRRAHFGAETLCIVVKRAGRWLSKWGCSCCRNGRNIHRFLVVTWARATQQRQAQAKSPLSVQIRRKWPEIEKLGLQWGPNACFLLLLPRDGKCQEW